jgi:hypothetical protein
MRETIAVIGMVICSFIFGYRFHEYSHLKKSQPVVIVANLPTFVKLREGAQAIMTETRAGGNTKVRIGMMYMDIIAKMEHIQYQVDSLKSMK